MTLAAVLDALANWPKEPEFNSAISEPYKRLIAAIRAAAVESTRVGPADLAALIKQVMLHEKLGKGGPPALEVPTVDGWPELADWSKYDVEAVGSATGARLLDVKPWRREWVHGDLSCIDLATSAPNGMWTGERRISSRARVIEPIPADPFLSEVAGISSYTTYGQREALRAVLSAPPGATIYVVLPTGTGKSLVAAVPGMINEGATTLVVVPTVALALDQERQFLERFGARLKLPRELAYVGERPDGEKAAIRDRLANGRQPIVFASPEAVVHGLGGSLYRLVRSGQLSHFVVDEAHLVAAWGDAFRPEFQQLPGLRWDLLRESELHGYEGFRTVLMTATLTRDSVELLDALFAGERNIFINATFIRPEPRFLLAPCESPQQRRQRLVDAVAQLPRPMIVYTTRRSDADLLAASLREAGLRRVDSFHGATPDGQRKRILDEWRGTSEEPAIDVVVATSAFGLGVDLANVRTVVHACIPESIDRYYQEVGRSGRDGDASIALLMPCYSEDHRVAEYISQRVLIADEKGFERWRAMIELSEPMGQGRFRVDTGELPSYRDAGNEKDRYWNLNTLTQMARAGLISLEAQPPPQRGRDEPEDEWETRREQAYEEFRRKIVVRIQGASALRTRDDWRVRTQPIRERTRLHDLDSLAAMERLARAASCWVVAFRALYALPPGIRLQDGTPVACTPVGACIGCPACQPDTRLEPPEVGDLVAPKPQPAYANPQLEPALRTLVDGRTLTVLTAEHEPSKWKREVLRALQSCVRNGILRIVIPEGSLDYGDLAQLHRHARDRVVYVDRSLGTPPTFKVPTVVVHPFGTDPVPLSYYSRSTPEVPRVLILPGDAADPERPQVLVRDIRTPCFSISRFVRSC